MRTGLLAGAGTDDGARNAVRQRAGTGHHRCTRHRDTPAGFRQGSGLRLCQGAARTLRLHTRDRGRPHRRRRVRTPRPRQLLRARRRGRKRGPHRSCLARRDAKTTAVPGRDPQRSAGNRRLINCCEIRRSHSFVGFSTGITFLFITSCGLKRAKLVPRSSATASHQQPTSGRVTT